LGGPGWAFYINYGKLHNPYVHQERAFFDVLSRQQSTNGCQTSHQVDTSLLFTLGLSSLHWLPAYEQVIHTTRGKSDSRTTGGTVEGGGEYIKISPYLPLSSSIVNMQKNIVVPLHCEKEEGQPLLNT